MYTSSLVDGPSGVVASGPPPAALLVLVVVLVVLSRLALLARPCQHQLGATSSLVIERASFATIRQIKSSSIKLALWLARFGIDSTTVI